MDEREREREEVDCFSFFGYLEGNAGGDEVVGFNGDRGTGIRAEGLSILVESIGGVAPLEVSAGRTLASECDEVLAGGDNDLLVVDAVLDVDNHTFGV